MILCSQLYLIHLPACILCLQYLYFTAALPAQGTVFHRTSLCGVCVASRNEAVQTTRPGKEMWAIHQTSPTPAIELW